MTHDYINEGERLDYVNEDIRLIQSTKGLTFGTDAYMLAAFIRSEGKNSVAAELGSGTGIISLLCAAKDKLKRYMLLRYRRALPDFARET